MTLPAWVKGGKTDDLQSQVQFVLKKWTLSLQFTAAVELPDMNKKVMHSFSLIGSFESGYLFQDIYSFGIFW